MEKRTIAYWAIAVVGAVASIAAVGLTARTLWLVPPQEVSDALLRSLEQPSPQLTPDQVVRLQIRALGASATSDDGVLQCYQFASPANRRATGPFPRFVAMIRSGSYAALLQQNAPRIGRPIVRGEHARVLVTFVDGNRRVRVYRFELSKQTVEPYLNCWMTDSVIQVLAQRHGGGGPGPEKVISDGASGPVI